MTAARPVAPMPPVDSLADLLRSLLRDELRRLLPGVLQEQELLDPVYTDAEVAARYGVKPSTVIAWRKRGELGYVAGKPPVILARHIREFEQRREVRARRRTPAWR